MYGETSLMVVDLTE